MQEAHINGYSDQMVYFMRSMLLETFKTNPYLEQGLMAGIARVGMGLIFSHLNTMEVLTTTAGKYEDSFGFTEEEVFSALDEYGLSERKGDVKRWYGDFTFGNRTDLYNPRSILNYLNTGQLTDRRGNISPNGLVEN